MSLSATSRRADIQALRGMAVLLVVAWHAFPKALPFGFIGVDVFFVVSGWLITGLIVTAQDEGRFSALQFWANRAKRLLPAAYATIALTLLGAWLVLAGRPLERLGGDVLGALTFTLNFRLAGTANYFAPASELLPLLHLWSLAVEEQFYLVLPLLL
ncbi:MAG TPA: acyltransferase, partial [Novosphingobium sp.]|nr:acyltransferase [Novosphingobium sp.]